MGTCRIAPIRFDTKNIWAFLPYQKHEVIYKIRVKGVLTLNEICCALIQLMLQTFNWFNNSPFLIPM